MKQITAADFKQAVELDPAWAAKLTEPVEVTDFCGMDETKISHLSPFLHFSGLDEHRCCASFVDCKHLKVAEGNFHGGVIFSASGVEKINPDGLTVTKTGRNETCAWFFGCESLKAAEGVFHGGVCFAHTGVERIGKLSVKPNEFGVTADFTECSISKENLAKTPADSLKALAQGKVLGLDIQQEVSRRRALERMKQPSIEL